MRRGFRTQRVTIKGALLELPQVWIYREANSRVGFIVINNAEGSQLRATLFLEEKRRELLCTHRVLVDIAALFLPTWHIMPYFRIAITKYIFFFRKNPRKRGENREKETGEGEKRLVLLSPVGCFATSWRKGWSSMNFTL